MRKPLVSVVVTNYNYGRFLKRCLSSVLNQTYDNIELIVCDNCSTDDSMPVILDFIKQYPNKVTLVRHRSNILSLPNFISGERLIRGDYFINLGADDYFASDYIETAIQLFQEYPEVSQIISHSDSVDDEGHYEKQAPFFDGSYLMDGESYASILMVAGVTKHTSQTIFDTAIHWREKERQDFLHSNTIGERMIAFAHAMRHDLIYLDQPFVVCREPVNNETGRLNADTTQIISQWTTIKAFAHYAQTYGADEVSARYQEGVDKLSQLCMRYAADCYKRGMRQVSGQYLGLSMLLDATFSDLMNGEDMEVSLQKITEKLQASSEKIMTDVQQLSMQRQHSYPPPKGSIPINLDSLIKEIASYV